MITIKYDANGTSGKKEEKHTEKQLKVPKNVRQVGEIPEQGRIYMEDYVVTYLNHMAHPVDTVVNGAILLGQKVKNGTDEILYISGAVEAPNISCDPKEIVFNNEIWSDLYKEIKKYFTDVTVVGWFLSRMGYSTELTQEICTLHQKHFSGEGKVLYIVDTLEQEEAFYITRQGRLQKQSGYYIYYEKNPQMQDYLVNQQALKEPEKRPAKEEFKDRQVLKNYREIMAGRQEQQAQKRVTGMLYVTSALLTIVFLALGITAVNNYDKLKSVQSSIRQLAMGMEQSQPVQKQERSNQEKAEQSAGEDTGTADVQEQTAQDPANTENNTETAEAATQETQNQESGDNPVAQRDPAAEEAAAQPENQDKQEEAVPAASQNVMNYYTVQQGDTLLSISQKTYHSDQYVQRIMQANELTESDIIYPGQQIVLPSID